MIVAKKMYLKLCCVAMRGNTEKWDEDKNWEKGYQEKNWQLADVDHLFCFSRTRLALNI